MSGFEDFVRRSPTVETLMTIGPGSAYRKRCRCGKVSRMAPITDQQESPAIVRRFAGARGLSFPVILDGGSVARAFRISVLPVSVFVDARGIVRLVR